MHPPQRTILPVVNAHGQRRVRARVSAVSSLAPTSNVWNPYSSYKTGCPRRNAQTASHAYNLGIEDCPWEYVGFDGSVVMIGGGVGKLDKKGREGWHAENVTESGIVRVLAV